MGDVQKCTYIKNLLAIQYIFFLKLFIKKQQFIQKWILRGVTAKKKTAEERGQQTGAQLPRILLADHFSQDANDWFGFFI